MSTRHPSTAPEENKLDDHPKTADASADNAEPVTTKYSTGSNIDNEDPPAEYTKGVSPDDFTPSEKEEPSTKPKSEASAPPEKPKYSDHIKTGQIQAIPNHPNQDQTHNDEPEFNTKGNYHSENRFLERADPDTEEDMPNSLQQAWEEGVRVGVQHFDKENFYSYKYARYHEPTNIIMLMDGDGMIQTVIIKFNDVINITTDHLIECSDPDCGRLYNKTDSDKCCHWCGYNTTTGRNKTKAELLPQKKSSNNPTGGS